MTALLASQGRRSPVHRYRDMDLSSRIDGASPHALVATLYEELITALDVLTRAIERGDSKLRLGQHERATTILHALDAGLDRVGGGELARSLNTIYRQMQRRLIAARAGDMAATKEVREGVANLAMAWNAIAR
ncbi:MAG: flagellar export chaperone FliS [Sphingomonadales bacterium]